MSETIHNSMNPAFKYFKIYNTDESFAKAVGEEDAAEGFEIGSSPEGYEDCVIAGHAVAKPKYFDILADSGYELLEVYSEGSQYFLGLFAGGRLYDVADEILEIMEIE